MEVPVRIVPDRGPKPRVRRAPPPREDLAPLVPDPRLDRRGYEAFYHDHAADWYMPSRIHGDILAQLRAQLGWMAPLGCVALDLNTYWIENQNTIYLRPDVIVGWPPDPDLGARSYRTWDHGLVALVVEIASDESRTRDLYTKVTDYAEGVQPHEYLYYDPHNDDLVLYRHTPAGYEIVPHAPHGVSCRRSGETCWEPGAEACGRARRQPVGVGAAASQEAPNPSSWARVVMTAASRGTASARVSRSRT